MPYIISISSVAQAQFDAMTAREQRLVHAAMQSHLVHEPKRLSKAVKALRPSSFAAFELRVGDLRVLYNVADAEVLIAAFGYKLGNRLFVEGKEFHGHQTHPSESSGGKPPGDTQ